MDKDLVAAMASPLVLAILAEHENYGYAILRRVRELSDSELEWSDGMLYPLLHRLERFGHIRSEWGKSPEGRRRRYYSITESGQAELAEQRRQWATATKTLGSIRGWSSVGFAGA